MTITMQWQKRKFSRAVKCKLYAYKGNKCKVEVNRTARIMLGNKTGKKVTLRLRLRDK